MSKNKVLIIAPHMDDEVLGCAGTIAKHVDSGDIVQVVFMANRIYNHHFDKTKSDKERHQALRAKSVLGYQKAVFLDLHDERLDSSIQDMIIALEEQVKIMRPGIVYLPFRGDNNQDHRAVFDAARVALRPLASAFINSMYMYEIPSSTEQSPPLQESAFLTNYYVEITDFMNKKIKAYRCYKTEKRVYPHPRSEKSLKVLAQKRGTEIGLKYAEAFMNIRSKWV